MFLSFDTTKTVQAIGVLLRAHSYCVASKLRILKLLYIADREAIRSAGQPILGTRTVAMDHGPLHSEVLDLINGKHVDEPTFAEFFEKSGYMVKMLKDPGVGQLSEFEIDELQKVCDDFRNVNDWSLAHDVCHTFKEFKSNHAEGTSSVITLEEIIDAVGQSERKDEILEEIRGHVAADFAFGKPTL
jgi:uncharacterized phage-associated protein